jgi:hypothetical protein
MKKSILVAVQMVSPITMVELSVGCTKRSDIRREERVEQRT